MSVSKRSCPAERFSVLVIRPSSQALSDIQRLVLVAPGKMFFFGVKPPLMADNQLTNYYLNCSSSVKEGESEFNDFAKSFDRIQRV